MALAGQGRQLLNKFLWSVASFASFFGFRLLSTLILTRLLAPELFGIMVIVNVMRFGIEVMTDVGIEQNIVRHPQGLSPAFTNTAWTMQICRGILLTALFLAIAPLLGSFYSIDTRIFLVIGFAPFLNSLHSTAIFSLVKQLDVKQRTLFEFRAELIGFVVTLVLALAFRSVWALVAGTLVAITARSALSYRLPGSRHRFMMDRGVAAEILQFGRWIMITSIIMFVSGNLDKLALGKVAPLALLGIYGLARTMADIPSQMARRLTYQLIFPLFSAARTDGDAAIVARLSPLRLRFVLLTALAMGVGIGCADWAIRILFDARYYEAGWMLSLLLPATFLSILANFNEGLLMSSGKPAYESAANVARLAILAIGLWYGYMWAGFAGAIAAVIAGELARYVVVAYGQRRTEQSFLKQDISALAVMLLVAALWIALRQKLGRGAPWDALTAAL